MLKEELTLDRVLVDDVVSWQDAIRRAGQPLLEAGAIRESYIDQIIANVQEPGGTYMDLGFGITLAHARPEAGALKTAFSVLTLREPVNLNDDEAHPVRTVVFLVAADDSAHQEALRDLATILRDEDRRDGLTHASDPHEMLNLLTAN
ncbi:PTS sugar transporter subunit IIA [Rothia uropygialis]|uniref:PTS sugar transporter subunit IIA n=1 Tax=Kocuria sp. 36 TaxID=1415402 RepID=UPI00101BDB1A|nr:PTS sugar transporter subunit IIA [Kocuria sp. 36]